MKPFCRIRMPFCCFSCNIQRFMFSCPNLQNALDAGLSSACVVKLVDQWASELLRGVSVCDNLPGQSVALCHASVSSLTAGWGGEGGRRRGSQTRNRRRWWTEKGGGVAGMMGSSLTVSLPLLGLKCKDKRHYRMRRRLSALLGCIWPLHTCTHTNAERHGIEQRTNQLPVSDDSS